MNVGNASRNGNRPKMLLEVVSDTIRRKHYSHRTEKATFNGSNTTSLTPRNVIPAKWEKLKSKPS